MGEVLLVARPAVLSGLPRSGHVVVEAAAGTGKTFTLEHLVVDLLLGHGIAIERLLVVTFTEKATEELRLRVRRKLQELLDLAGQPQPAPSATEAWRLDDEARNRLRDALVRFDTATIATIHGFCQRVLTEHAFAHRRLFDQRLVDTREMYDTAFRDVLRRGLGPQDPLRGPLESFLRGGGTVRDLEELVFEACSQRGELTPRWDPPALSAAARELRDAWSENLLAQALGAAGSNLRGEVVPTYARLGELATGLAEGSRSPAELAEELIAWGAEKHQLAATRASRWQHLKRGLEVLAAADFPPAARLRDALDRVAAVAAPPLPALVGALRLAVRERLEAHKRSRGLYDFDDMLLQVREGVSGPTADAALVAALRARWSVALVDEFQDTDEVQWEIFRSLFFASPAHRLFLIGDPRQAIYGFRNADVHTYLAARQEVLAGGGERVPLLANYRSTPPLIDACNRVFAEEFFTGPLARVEPAVAGDPTLRLTDAAGRSLAPVVVWRVRRDGKRPPADATRTAIAERIAAEARALVEGGARFGAAGAEGPAAEHPLRYADLQVLVRAHREAQIVAAALGRHGIPSVLFGQDGLLETAEAEHVQRLLTALAAPADAAARLQAWLTPFFDVPLAALAGCRDLPETHPLVERLLAWSTDAEARRYAVLFRRVFHESGLVRRLLVTRQGERALTDYQHLFDLLLEEAHRSPAPLGELAGRLREWMGSRARPPGADATVQRLEPARDAVQILTMHRAKGLQAAVVFIAGGFGDSGSQDRLKVYHRREGERCVHLGDALGDVALAIARERREEDERLLYVALTRARGRLYLPWLGGSSGRLGGAYELVDRRLDRLMAGTPPAGFELVEVPCAAPDPAAAPPPLRWPPAEGWPPPPPLRDPTFAELRRSRAGRLLTSYSRVRRGAAFGPEETAADGDAALEPPLVVALDELPGGRASGTFVHRLLEDLDLEVLRRSPSADEWSARPEVAALGRRLAGELAFPPRNLPAALRLAWRALRTPIAAGGLLLPEGLATPLIRSVETELTFPIPEGAHPRLGEAPVDDGEPPFRAERGFVQGVVDLIFEHDDRTYFVDWKTDRLPSFEAAALAAHVEEHYRLQAQLYALGVLRLLGITGEQDHARRFGGLCYCFVRGMGPGGIAGIHFERPTWDELRAWEDTLRQRQAWGQAWELPAPEPLGVAP